MARRTDPGQDRVTACRGVPDLVAGWLPKPGTAAYLGNCKSNRNLAAQQHVFGQVNHAHNSKAQVPYRGDIFSPTMYPRSSPGIR